jgi:hypothetical protein
MLTRNVKEWLARSEEARRRRKHRRCRRGQRRGRRPCRVLGAPSSNFFVEKNRGADAEFLVSSAWRGVYWNGGATSAMAAVPLGNLHGRGKERERMTRTGWQRCDGEWRTRP